MDVLIYNKNILVEMEDLFRRINDDEITSQEVKQLEIFLIHIKKIT
jgi:hypothetical protein